MRQQTALNAKLRGHLALSRISNAPTVVSNVLAGMALASTVAGGSTSKALSVCLAMILYYTAGMYFNDIFDLSLDREQRPERPLPSGRVPVGEAFLVAVGLLLAGTLLLAFVGKAALVAGILLAGLIILYDLWHKGNPYGPLLMALTRVFVYLTAFFALSTQLTPGFFLWALLLGGYILGLTAIAKTEVLAKTDYWPLALLYAPVLLAVLTLPWYAFMLPLIFALWVSYNCFRVYETREIGPAIAGFIAGISLFDALVIAVYGQWGLLIWAFLAFGLTLYLQRFVKGT